MRIWIGEAAVGCYLVGRVDLKRVWLKTRMFLSRKVSVDSEQKRRCWTTMIGLASYPPPSFGFLFWISCVLFLFLPMPCPGGYNYSL